MSHILNRNYSRVRDVVLTGSSSDLSRMKPAWDDLLNCLQPPTSFRGDISDRDPVHQWRMILSSDAIPGAIQLLREAIARDTIVSESALHLEIRPANTELLFRRELQAPMP